MSPQLARLTIRIILSGIPVIGPTLTKVAVELSPRSANAYDSLGEAYMRAGDTKKAVENYRRSLELDPKNANAAEMLKKLREKKRKR